jgi:glycine cleavage system aminomethyltransferase T
MADSSELTKLELSGPVAPLRDLVRWATGENLSPGGVIQAAGAWWCGVPDTPAERTSTSGRVIVLCHPSRGGRLRDHLAARTVRQPDVRLRDRTDDWAAITVLGAATARVLGSLGVFGESGDPRHVPPFTTGALEGLHAMWLLESEHRALVLIAGADADAAWHAIERAGRAQHICCVGQDALARYELLERRSAHPA